MDFHPLYEKNMLNFEISGRLSFLINLTFEEIELRKRYIELIKNLLLYVGLESRYWFKTFEMFDIMFDIEKENINKYFALNCVYITSLYDKFESKITRLKYNGDFKKFDNYLISEEEIKNNRIYILKTLDYNLEFPIYNNFLDYYCNIFKITEDEKMEIIISLLDTYNKPNIFLPSYVVLFYIYKYNNSVLYTFPEINIEDIENVLEYYNEEETYYDKYLRNPHIRKGKPLHEIKKLTKIGSGAQANIYSIKYNNQFMALKEYTDISNDRYLGSILREISLLVYMDNENIQKIENISTGRFLDVIMPLADRDLWEAIQKGRGISDFLRHEFIRQIIEGINYMHSVGVYHGDLKSENILLKSRSRGSDPTSSSMITGGENLFITDFGFSKLITTKIIHEIYGTFIMTSPELLLQVNDKFMFQPDMWAVGIVILEILKVSIEDLFNINTNNKFLFASNMINVLGNSDYYENFPSVYRRISNIHIQENKSIINYLEDKYLIYYDLILGLLDMNPKTRLNSYDALLMFENI